MERNCTACNKIIKAVHHLQKYCKPCATEAERESKRKNNQKYRADALAHYGNQCACCGLVEPRFLTLDHIHGMGKEHRREIGNGGTSLYRWLKKHGYPEGFQTLCWNCNCAKGHYGICPHNDTTN